MNVREWSWVLYDVGNSAFVMLATTVIPIYFGSLIAEGDSVVVVWGYTETVVALLVALLMPFLGSLADYRKNKKKFFIGSAGTGIVALAALGIQGEAMLFLAFYVIAAVGLNTSMVFYDAFLIDVTDEGNYDALSAKGYGWGYIGSLVPFIACMGLILGSNAIGLETTLATRLSFAITAAWWLAFTVPIVTKVHQTHYKPYVSHAVRSALRDLRRTVGAIVHDKKMLFFLLAFFCYIDGVHTIIKLATSFGTDLGIDSTQLILALIITQVVAFPAALIFARLSRSVGARRMLLIAIAAYALMTLYAAAFLYTATEFWILAIAVGLFQGGIQALSRSYFSKLVPKQHANEYFGFFDIFGKYATIVGTFMMSAFTQFTGNAHIGILSITALFIAGGTLLLLMPKEHSPQT
jgi:UMF1 family MFS transporter